MDIIQGRPRAIRRARLFYYMKDGLSNENKYVDPLFFLRKTTTTTTLDITDKYLIGPLLVRVLVVLTTLLSAPRFAVWAHGQVILHQNYVKNYFYHIASLRFT